MNNDFYKTLNVIALLAALVVSALGFVVIIGWNTQSIALVQLTPSFAPMQYNTAICFVFCGVGLMAVMYGRSRVAMALGILVTVICSLTLSQYLFGYNSGIDTLFIKPFTNAQTSHVGRMSPTTAVCFLFMGVSLILCGIEHGLMGFVSIFGAILCAVGATVVLGYAVDLPTAYWWGQATRMAAHTASAFVLLGVGLLCFWRRYSKPNNISSRWTVASVGIASLLVALGLWQAIGAQRDMDLARNYDMAIANARDNIASRLDTRIKALERMARRWNVRGGIPQPEWEADAKAYINDYTGIQTLAWADSSLSIKWVVSHEADKAIDDAKLITEVHLRKAAQAARDGNKIYFSPIFDITNGNEDHLIFIPVYRNKEYDGEIICFLRTKDFLATVLQLDALNEYSITIYDDDRLIYTNEKNARAARQQAVREAQVKSDGGNWTIYLAPGSKQIAATRNIIPASILVAGLLITLLLAWTTHQTLRSRLQADEAVDLNIELANQVAERKLSEKLLEANEELLKQFIAHTPAAIAMLDKDLCYLQVSEQWREDYHLDGQDVIGKSHYEVFPDIPERWKESHRRVLKGAVEQCSEDPFPREDGSVEWLQWEARPWRKIGGEIGGLIFFTQVITERKRAEEELRASEARFAGILDIAEDAIISVNKEQRITIFNKGAERIFGYTAQEIMNQPLEILLPHRYAHAHYGHVSAFSSSQDGSRRMADRKEVFGLRKDGTEFPAEISISKLKLGNDVIFTSIVRDITESKRVEEELRASEARFAGILDIAEDGIISVNQNQNITIFNKGAERIFGYNAEEVLNRPLDVLLPERLVSVHHQHVNEFASSLQESLQVTSQREVMGRRKNGTEFPTEASISKLKLGDEVIFTSVVRDITERKQMEEDLRHAHDTALEAVRLKSEFLANMSHEIRTPMNGIIGMTELMQESGLNEDQRKYLNTIQSGAESLLTIIGDILDFSKIEAGMLNFETIDFNLRSTVESVMELLSERAHGKDLETAVVFHPDVPTQLCGDPTRLKQILTNLLGNAIKFTEWGEVVVRVSKQSEDDERAVIRFDVKDTGIGISEESQKFLFKPFSQADGSMTRRYGGTGLGLAISKQLAELMGGGISINSVQGHGSTFTFTASFIKQASQEVETLPENVNLKDVRVLVVDDNHTNRQILIQHMTAWGVISEEAENGATALKKLTDAAINNKPFQLAILDQKMPDMNEAELAKLIKADSSISDTKLVLMPSYSKRGQGKLALEAGFSAYFTKPVRQNQLFDCLSAVISDKSNRRKATKKLITQHSLKEMKESRNRYILLVEDNEINQTVTLGQLGILGYRVDVASNGHEALAALEHKNYDAVLMDCQMPMMDGYKTTTEIRKREDNAKHTPVIAMTAHAMKGDREKCLAAGMDDYLAKPVKKDALKAILDNLFESGSKATARIVEEELETAIKEDTSPVDVERMMDAVSNNYEKLRQLADLYIHHTAERLDELRTAINQSAADEVYQVAHKCLGSSLTFGMIGVVPSMKELERMGKESDLQEAENHLNTAQTEFERIKIFLEGYLLQSPK